MRRADKRSPRGIAIQRLTSLIELPDRDLCQTDHRTARLPGPHKPCARRELDENGRIIECALLGEWAAQQPGTNTTRVCVHHAATTIRARLWLQRRRLELNTHGELS